MSSHDTGTWRSELRERLSALVAARLPGLEQSLEAAAASLAFAPERLETAIDAGDGCELLALRLIDLLDTAGRVPEPLAAALATALDEVAVRAPAALHLRRVPGAGEAGVRVDPALAPVLAVLLLGLCSELEPGGSIEVEAGSEADPVLLVRLGGGRAARPARTCPVAPEVVDVLLASFGAARPAAEPRREEGGRVVLRLGGQGVG